MAAKNRKYTIQQITIGEFHKKWLSKIDCMPVGQRLPVKSSDKSKEVGIIKTLIDGFDFGLITIMHVSPKEDSIFINYEFESIDGGHRKRALASYLNNEFSVNGKFFGELTEDEQEAFLSIPLTFCIYEELDCVTKGLIFRTLNKTTDVNFIEMLNSYGDTPIANFVRETVRFVPQIDNAFHDLFEFNLNAKNEANYKYLSFDNDRLKQDHFFSRIAYRYVMHSKNLLGGSPDAEIEEMYESTDIDESVIKRVEKKTKAHLNFLRTMAILRKQRFKTGLTQHEIKVLSYLYFYLLDTYGAFSIKDSEVFFEAFASANSALLNKDGRFKNELVPGDSGYNVPTMYKKFIGAPWSTPKITEAVSYLVREMPDLESLLIIKDTTRTFSKAETIAKLSEQKFKCAIDGRKLNLSDAEAAHIIAHTNGGRTVYSNLAMVRAVYNKEMGSMNLNDYRDLIRSTKKVA